MKTILINSTHVVSGTNNSKFKVDLPPSAGPFKDQQVAVSSISLYYSWDNITSAQSNNTFSYIWPTSTGTTTVTLTIPDGSYSIDDLNFWLQSKMIENGHYLVSSSGDYIYYIEFKTNSVLYSIQLYCYTLPTSLPSGYTNPASMTFPASTFTPQIIIPSTNFRDIIGFTAGTYPPTQQTSNYSTTSSYTPQVSPTQSVIVTCNLVNNGLTNPPNVLYSFTPSGVDFGSIIESKPPSPLWVDVSDGFYNSVEIQLYNQTYSKLVVKDPNLVILLSIKHKDE